MTGAGAAVAWIETPGASEPLSLPAVAAVSLLDPRIEPLTRLGPTPADLADLGRRVGADARRFLARRALLRSLVAGHLETEPAKVLIRYGPEGAPEVCAAGLALCCSVAARGDWAAVALDRGRIGVDLEPVEDGLIPWAVFAPSERAAIEVLPAARRTEDVLRRWTLKEAYLKAIGLGLRRDPAEIEIDGEPAAARIRDRGMALATRAVEVRRIAGPYRPLLVALVAL